MRWRCWARCCSPAERASRLWTTGWRGRPLLGGAVAARPKCVGSRTVFCTRPQNAVPTDWHADRVMWLQIRATPFLPSESVLLLLLCAGLEGRFELTNPILHTTTDDSRHACRTHGIATRPTVSPSVRSSCHHTTPRFPRVIAERGCSQRGADPGDGRPDGQQRPRRRRIQVPGDRWCLPLCP